MSHDRTEKPVVCRDASHAQGHEIQRQNSENEQIRTLPDSKSTNSRLNHDRRSEQKLNVVVLIKETNAIDEINNFFMNSY